MRLSRRAAGLAGSATSRAVAVPLAAGPSGAPIDLGAGDADWEPPPEALTAAESALKQTGYGRPGGEIELLQTVASEYGAAAERGEAVATTGGKEALFLALGAVVEPGDAVVVVAPYWPTFIEQIKFFGGVPVIISPKNDDPEMLAKACRGARGIIVNTPGNPSGRGWSRAAAEIAVAHARTTGAWVLVDAVYAALTYGSVQVDAAWFRAQCPDRTLIVDAASKRLALPGLRVGWAVGPAEWIDGMRRLQDASTTHPSRPGQAAALAGLRAEARWLPDVRARLSQRSTALREALAAVGLEMNAPSGGLFGLVSLDGAGESGQAADVAFARRLIAERSLKTVPGSAFGAPNTLRLALRA
ncbi:MAG: pyridoxal phosphate-dependent aminotransferase, partial [Myxococcota bacterium]